MKILFNKTFFRFVLGFTALIALGVVGVAMAGLQAVDQEQAALQDPVASDGQEGSVVDIDR